MRHRDRTNATTSSRDSVVFLSARYRMASTGRLPCHAGNHSVAGEASAHAPRLEASCSTSHVSVYIIHVNQRCVCLQPVYVTMKEQLC